MFIAKIYHLSRKIKLLFYPSWNRLKFRVKGVSFGENLYVYTKIFLEKGHNACITIGNNFIFSSGDCINPLCRNIKGCIVANPNTSISIGNNVGMFRMYLGSFINYYWQ